MRAIFSATLLAAALLAAPRAADACSCMPPGFTTFLAPGDGATDVPTNTLVWVGGAAFGFETPFDQAQVVVKNPEGSVVQGTTTVLLGGDDGLVVFRPAIALTPGATYVVSANEQRLGAFTVGTGRDDTPPAIPTVAGQEENVAGPGSGVSSCGESNYAAFTLAHDGLFAVTMRDGDTARLDETKPAGTVTALAASNPKRVLLGNTGCSSTWPEADAGASTKVRFGAFDLAGNFSGFGERLHVDLPLIGCGCASPGPLALGAFGLLVLGLRRRRPGTSR